jgi:hypothetical protein
LEQGRFGARQNLPALIENWSSKIGYWQFNSTSLPKLVFALTDNLNPQD